MGRKPDSGSSTGSSHEAVLTGSGDNVSIQRSLMLTDDELGTKGELVDVGREYGDWGVRPLTTDGSFDFADPSYLSEGFRLYSRVAAAFAAHRHTRAVPLSIFLQRAWFEMAALLHQLHVRLDCRSIWIEEQQAAGLN